MHTDSMQLIKAGQLVRFTVTYMPDGLVQLCLPARWSGMSIGDITADLRQVQQIHLLVNPTTTDVLASQLQLFQTYLLVRCNSNRHTAGRVQL